MHTSVNYNNHQLYMHTSVNYFLSSEGRDPHQVAFIEQYLHAVGLFRNFLDASEDPVFSEVVELDLSSVVPSLSGPKRPHDRVSVAEMKQDFQMCLDNKVCWGTATKDCVLVPESLACNVASI